MRGGRIALSDRAQAGGLLNDALHVAEALLGFAVAAVGDQAARERVDSAAVRDVDLAETGDVSQYGSVAQVCGLCLGGWCNAICDRAPALVQMNDVTDYRLARECQMNHLK